MRNFNIERIRLRKLQAIAKQHDITPDIINQAIEVAIHNYEKENGVISIDYDKLRQGEGAGRSRV